MTRQQLIDLIKKRRSYLCVGLDTDPGKIPGHLQNEADPIFTFNKAIIDATRDLCVAYKLNTAFYEAMGVRGWEALDKTVKYIGPDHFTIADAKRGDIGNTSDQYAKAFFETMPFDSITIAPYMGEDSVRPFLAWPGKWAIVLGLTSNAGASDFELKRVSIKSDILEEGVHTVREISPYLYEIVLKTVSEWGNTGNLMFVVGATRESEFINIRKLIPEHFLLVPGVGAQGGSLAAISSAAMNSDCGILVNASRAIIYKSGNKDFAEAAREVAARYQKEMEQHLQSIFPD